MLNLDVTNVRVSEIVIPNTTRHFKSFKVRITALKLCPALDAALWQTHDSIKEFFFRKKLSGVNVLKYNENIDSVTSDVVNVDDYLRSKTSDLAISVLECDFDVVLWKFG